jgi:hypothetical protein
VPLQNSQRETPQLDIVSNSRLVKGLAFKGSKRRSEVSSPVARYQCDYISDGERASAMARVNADLQ